MRFGWVVLTMMCLKFGCLATVMAADPKASATATAGAGAVAAGALDPALTKVAETFRAAMLAGDAAAVVSVYRDDAVEMPMCAAPVRGKAAIEQYYRGLFAQVGGKFNALTLTHLDAHATGDDGVVVGTSTSTVTLPSKQTADDTGKYIVILKRTAGQWKVAYSMYSSDHPQMPTAAAASR